MQAKKKKVEQLAPSDLGVALNPFVKTLGVEAPPARKTGSMVETVDQLVDKLRNEAKVI